MGQRSAAWLAPSSDKTDLWIDRCGSNYMRLRRFQQPTTYTHTHTGSRQVPWTANTKTDLKHTKTSDDVPSIAIISRNLRQHLHSKREQHTFKREDSKPNWNWLPKTRSPERTSRSVQAATAAATIYVALRQQHVAAVRRVVWSNRATGSSCSSMTGSQQKFYSSNGSGYG